MLSLHSSQPPSCNIYMVTCTATNNRCRLLRVTTMDILIRDIIYLHGRSEGGAAVEVVGTEITKLN